MGACGIVAIVLGVLIGIPFTIGVVRALSGGGSSKSSKSESAKHSVTVAAEDLFTAYHANEVAADEQYKGATVHVYGHVHSIEKGAFGNIVVRLSVANQFESVMCSFDDSEKSTVAKLAKGDFVNFTCDGAGMIIGSPSLKGCAVK